MSFRVFGLNFQSGKAAECRPPGEGEARVWIFTKAGHLVCQKIGMLKTGGTCSVVWLGERVPATYEPKRRLWVYRIPTTPGEEASGEAAL